jgi:hypothetical protein
VAKYRSNYSRLAFTVEGEVKRFANGVFETTDKAVIKELDKLVNATKVTERKAPKQTKDAGTKKTGTTKTSTATKSSTTRKSSEK